MPTDFRYVPTSGDLSGQDFEKQTERALNELGEEIDGIDGSAQEAINKAENAEAIANSAINAVDAAVSAANDATEAANQATSTAAASLAVANAAQGTANNALDSATVADSKAVAAQNSANAAQSTANNALDIANLATQQAESAELTAQSAITQVTEETTFTLVEDGISLNDFFQISSKMYLTSNDVENAPDEITTPFYFMIQANSTPSSATQWAWSEATPQNIYVRMATDFFFPEEPSDPEAPVENPSATFSGWELVGVAGSFMPFPQTTEGVGQVALVTNGYTPPGGTWLSWVLQYDASFSNTGANVIRSVSFFRIDAGGTYWGSSAYRGFSWRIA